MLCSLQTLYSPEAAKSYKEHGRRQGWGGAGSNKTGRAVGGGGSARINGMSNLGGGGSGKPLAPPSPPLPSGGKL